MDRIQIIEHQSLFDDGLEEMVGMTGIIVEDFTGEERKCKGYNVMLDEEFMGERLWFVDNNAVKEI